MTQDEFRHRKFALRIQQLRDTEALLKEFEVEHLSGELQVLQDLHKAIGELCKLLGDNPDNVPCDVFRLHELIEELRSDARVAGGFVKAVCCGGTWSNTYSATGTQDGDRALMLRLSRKVGV